MNRQLTVQESRHRLARVICHGRRGQIHQAYREGQEDQLGCLGLVLNAVTLWMTRYLDAAVTQLRAQGVEVRAEDAARLSPLRRRRSTCWVATPSSPPNPPKACGPYSTRQTPATKTYWTEPRTVRLWSAVSPACSAVSDPAWRRRRGDTADIAAVTVRPRRARQGVPDTPAPES